MKKTWLLSGFSLLIFSSVSAASYLIPTPAKSVEVTSQEYFLDAPSDAVATNPIFLGGRITTDHKQKMDSLDENVKVVKGLRQDEEINFWIEPDSLQGLGNVSWQWHYNSDGIHCFEKSDAILLACRVDDDRVISDVWVEFFAPDIDPDTAFGSNVINVYPAARMGEEKVSFEQKYLRHLTPAYFVPVVHTDGSAFVNKKCLYNRQACNFWEQKLEEPQSGFWTYY